jgi:hypothetical protein
MYSKSHLSSFQRRKIRIDYKLKPLIPFNYEVINGLLFMIDTKLGVYTANFVECLTNQTNPTFKLFHRKF